MIRFRFFVICLVTLFMTGAVFAQENSSTTTPLASATTQLNPKNKFSIAVEAVDSYHGGVVGEIFEKDPAPRFLARYARATTKAGTFYFDGWFSAGRRFNQEADAVVGYQNDGWDISFGRFFVRGGDIDQTAVSKSGQIKINGRTVGGGAELRLYTKARETSPPGGVVGKVWAGYSHPTTIDKLELRHTIQLGLDNNPFGLGEKGEPTLMGFYKVEAAYRPSENSEWYVNWLASRPIAGQGNTTREFRNSFSFGYRRTFSW